MPAVLFPMEKVACYVAHVEKVQVVAVVAPELVAQLAQSPPPAAVGE